MWADADRLLAGRGRYAIGGERLPVARIACTVLLAGFVYGAAMGSLGWRERAVLFSALKAPILLTAAFMISLPANYVLHALLGLRADFPAVVRGILSAQGTLALTLLALAPVTLFFNASGIAYGPALFWSGCAFLAAALAGQVTLARHYQPLVARDRRHRIAFVAWFALYAFTSIKVGWVLRPFVGDPALPVTFLREGRWSDNPYINLFWNAVGMVWTLVRSFAGG